MLRLSTAVQAAAIMLVALLPLATPSYAQEQKPAEIYITFVNAGFIVGVSGGSGTLVYQGKRYPLKIGGVSLGATFGASKAQLSGTVLNLNNVSDIAGTYGATEAGPLERQKNGQVEEYEGRRFGAARQTGWTGSAARSKRPESRAQVTT